MGENDYSVSIKKAIISYAKSCGKRYARIVEEGKIWLKAPESNTSFYQFPYKPEVRLTRKSKNGRETHSIFEVLDSQLKDPNLIIADIIQGLLVEGATHIVFIAPTDEGEEKARSLSETLGGILKNKLFEATWKIVPQKKLFQIARRYSLPEILCYRISYAEAENPETLQGLLAQWANEDGW
jgi:hypothetical protein